MHRITHVISSAGVGGGERHLLQLARHLEGSEFHLDFVLPDEGSFCDRLREAGLPYSVVRMDKKFRLGGWRELERLFQSNKTNLVHSHGARASWYGRIAARRAGITPLVTTIHNSLRDYPYSRLRKRLYVTAEQLTARWVSKWIAVSEALKRDLVEYYGLPEGQITVIPNGVDLQDLKVCKGREEVRRELGLASNSLVLISIARLTRQKGHRFLLDALSRIHRSLPDVTLVLAGDGPMRPSLEAQIQKLNLQEKVRLLGFRTDVADLIQASDIYVLPSISEGMPIGLMEAMALGCPVVASSVSGVPEVVQDGENGRLVPAREVDRLHDALLELSKDAPLRERLAGAGRDTVLQRFTAKQTASQVAALYRRCLNPDYS